MLYKKLIFSILLILTVCVTIWANFINSKRNDLIYQDLNYLKLNYIELDSLKRNLVENKFINDSLLNQEFSFYSLEKHINNIDFFYNSNVFRSVDSKIKITINEKDPVMFLEHQNKYVDLNGDIIPLSKIYKPETIFFVGKIDSINLMKAIKISSQIKNDEFLFSHIDYIFMDQTNMYLKTVNQNYLIKFGDLNSIQEKLKKYKIFYGAKAQLDLLSEIDNINLSFKNQVVIENNKNEK
ncbi:MAG: hypothetical protein DBW74_00770 [Cryomorphaceae bacterium]|nr:MAG: hypothetical protein DBW74_00770 [Cryomorphaceae bacterium]